MTERPKRHMVVEFNPPTCSKTLEGNTPEELWCKLQAAGKGDCRIVVRDQHGSTVLCQSESGAWPLMCLPMYMNKSRLWAFYKMHVIDFNSTDRAVLIANIRTALSDLQRMVDRLV